MTGVSACVSLVTVSLMSVCVKPIQACSLSSMREAVNTGCCGHQARLARAPGHLAVVAQGQPQAPANRRDWKLGVGLVWVSVPIKELLKLLQRKRVDYFYSIFNIFA